MEDIQIQIVQQNINDFKSNPTKASLMWFVEKNLIDLLYLICNEECDTIMEKLTFEQWHSIFHIVLNRQEQNIQNRFLEEKALAKMDALAKNFKQWYMLFESTNHLLSGWFVDRSILHSKALHKMEQASKDCQSADKMYIITRDSKWLLLMETLAKTVLDYYRLYSLVQSHSENQNLSNQERKIWQEKLEKIEKKILSLKGSFEEWEQVAETSSGPLLSIAFNKMCKLAIETNNFNYFYRIKIKATHHQDLQSKCLEAMVFYIS